MEGYVSFANVEGLGEPAGSDGGVWRGGRRGWGRWGFETWIGEAVEGLGEGEGGTINEPR